MRSNLLIFLFLTIFLTACGQGLEIKTLEKNISDSNVELTDLEVSSLKAMEDLESEIYALEQSEFSDLQNPGTSLSKLNSFKKSLGFKLDGIVDAIKKLKEKTTDLRKKINDYIAILDPNDPNQNALIERLKELLKRLDVIEAKIDDVIAILQSKLDFIDEIFDRLIDRLDPTNPKDILLRLVIEAIRDMIKDKLNI